MIKNRKHAVTGAFGFTGKYIAQTLLSQGAELITLTQKTCKPDPFRGQVKSFPWDFDKPDKIALALENVDVLYNTYWVRFDNKRFSHLMAVGNTLKLFNAAREAGVRKIVHISISNPSIDSKLGYFKGKAQLENELINSGLEYTILRPTIIFGIEDILINNIAWVIRRFPVFGLFGKGDYKLQPIFVRDLAELAVHHGYRNDNSVLDAIGPETLTYRDFILSIMDGINSRKPVVGLRPSLAFLASRIVGRLNNDITLTTEEVEALTKNYLYTDSRPLGKTKFSDWVKDYGNVLGKEYRSEAGKRIQLERLNPIFKPRVVNDYIY